MTTQLHDAFVIDGVRKTEDGYLAAFAKVARTGIQIYRGSELGRPDLDKVRVYRPPEEVFHADALKSFAHRPVTMRHPPVPVTAKNWKKFAGGQTGDEVVRDGEFVRVPLVMMDSAMIDAYERDGIKELSMGYSTDIQWRTGVTDAGEEYDAVQTDIRANHLALVPVARGGDQLRLGDEDDLDDEDLNDNWSDAARAAALEARKHRSQMKYHDDQGHLAGYSAKGGNSANHNYAALQHEKAATAFEKAAEAYKKGDKDEGDKHAQHAKKKARVAWRAMDSVGDETDLYDREFDEKERKKLAKTGAAMPGGEFPIETIGDLKNAIQAIGRAKDPVAAKAHIKSRAKALGAEELLPGAWTTDEMSTCPKCGAKMTGKKCPECNYVKDSTEGEYTMKLVLDGLTVNVADDQSGAIIEKHIATLTKQVTDARAELTTVTDAQKKMATDLAAATTLVQTKDGEIAVLKKQVTDAAITPQVLDKMVKDRLAVSDAAKSFLAKEYVFDTKSVEDIRRDAVVAHLGDSAKAMTDEVINGAFLAMTKDAKTVTADQQISSAMMHRPHSTTQVADARDAAYAENIKNLESAWKTPTNKVA